MTEKTLNNRLVEKSVEAFITGLELYNKPTLRYRIEGFSFFLTNAWELMLKAHILNIDGESGIYFADNPERTIDLSKAMRKIYTNDKDPLRINLEKIIDLRNTSTHFITEDYETAYAPLFQAAVINYTNQLLKLHDVDITKYVPQNFLTLSISLQELSDAEIKAKYSPQMAERFIKQRNDVFVTDDLTGKSANYSIPINQQLFITKDPKKADFTVAIDRTSDTTLAVAKELKDPSDTHRYSYSNIIKEVNKRIVSSKIDFQVVSIYNGKEEVKNKFTRGHLTLFINFYDVKNNIKYAFAHKLNEEGDSLSYTYSQQFVDFIFLEIKKDPKACITKLKQALESK